MHVLQARLSVAMVVATVAIGYWIRLPSTSLYAHCALKHANARPRTLYAPQRTCSGVVEILQDSRTLSLRSIGAGEDYVGGKDAMMAVAWGPASGSE